MPSIHPTAIVDPKATIGADVEIGPYCMVGPHVTLGDRVTLRSHVVVEGLTSIGEDGVVFPYAYLGAPPQHTGHDGSLTRLAVGARAHVREYVTMHCGTSVGRGVTTIGDDCIFYLGAHVAHDCIVGDHVLLVNNATLGGHVKIDEYAIMGGLSAAHQWTRIGRHSNISGLAAVTRDIIPFGSAWGNHAHLEGLNLVGLKRRGFARETINTLRAAYGVLFAEQGTFQERLDDVATLYAGTPEVMEIVDFIRADANRPLCMPDREV